MGRNKVIGPAVAGTWYPLARERLAGDVDRLLEAAASRVASPRGRMQALIVPHAGFVYSGAVAAAAFSCVRGSAYERILLIGPSHYFGFHGAAVPDQATAFRTPLGDVPIDLDAVSALRQAAAFRADDAIFEPEHALEVELPFLQRALPGSAAYVPVVMGGGATYDDAKRVADALAPLVRESTLLVVSSDFTHFGPRFDFTPFVDDVPARIRALDMGAISAIEAGDAAGFARYVEATGATICGHRAIDVYLLLSGSGAQAGARLLEYDTSGRMTASWDHSVSYAAIAADGTGSAER